MRTYRKTVGWTVRAMLAPLLAIYLIALFALHLTAAILEASIRFILEFGARLETWEAIEPNPEWRPLKESILEQRETDWTPIKDDRLDT